jgi:hypothetical protein
MTRLPSFSFEALALASSGAMAWRVHMPRSISSSPRCSSLGEFVADCQLHATIDELEGHRLVVQGDVHDAGLAHAARNWKTDNNGML